MSTDPKKPVDCEDDDVDEVTIARSILDEIIEETESEEPFESPSDDSKGSSNEEKENALLR